MEPPFFGSRQMRSILRDNSGHMVGRSRANRLMDKGGLMAI